MKYVILFMLSISIIWPAYGQTSPPLEFHSILINGKDVLSKCACDEETGTITEIQAIKNILKTSFNESSAQPNIDSIESSSKTGNK